MLKQYEEGLSFLITNQKTICTEYYSQYLSVLHKQEKIERLLDEAKKMHSLFQIDSSSLKWICTIFNEKYVEAGVLIEDLDYMTHISDDLLKLDKSSPIAFLTKAILFIEKNDLVQAKNSLNQTLVMQPTSLPALFLLLRCSIKLLLYPEAKIAANKIDQLLLQTKVAKVYLKIKDDLDVLMLEALSKSDDKDDWIRVLEMQETVMLYFKRLFKNRKNRRLRGETIVCLI